MIVSTKTAEEMLEEIQNRMKKHQDVLNKLEMFQDSDAEEITWHRACICELRYVRNIIELRYL